VVLSDGIMIGHGTPGEAVRIFRERLMEAGDTLALGGVDEPGPEPEAPSGPAVLSTSIQVTAEEMKGSQSDSSRPVRITDVVAFYPEANERRYLLPRETLIVRATYNASEPSAGVVVAIEFRLDDGTVLFRTDTEILGLAHDLPAGPGAVDFHFDDLPLFDGSYLVNIGITGPGGILYDWREPACTFEVMNPGRSTGVIAIPVKVAIVPTELVASA